MIRQPHILFCENPLAPKSVEPDFEADWYAAAQNGFKNLLFNFDDLIDSGNCYRATKTIMKSGELLPVIYRGWMLTPSEYTALYNDLLAKNYRLINSPTEYQNCHYLPDSLKYIGGHTPETIYLKATVDNFVEHFIAMTSVFSNQPIIIKDFVKSEKHDWHTACFVPDASDTLKLRQTIEKFLTLRGRYLNVGLVARAFVSLNPLTIHSKSSMPLTEEYRLFFVNNKLLGTYDYWEEGEYDVERPDIKPFESIAKTVESNFFTMDIARRQDGTLLVM